MPAPREPLPASRPSLVTATASCGRSSNRPSNGMEKDSIVSSTRVTVARRNPGLVVALDLQVQFPVLLGRSLRAFFRRIAVITLLKLVDQSRVVGISASAIDDVGDLTAVQGAGEPLVIVDMARNNGVGLDTGGPHRLVQRRSDIRRAAMGPVERVGRMVDRNHDETIALSRRVELILEPPVLLVGSASVQGTFHIGVEPDDGDQRRLQSPIHVRLGHGRPIRADVTGLDRAEVLHESVERGLGVGFVSWPYPGIAVVVARNGEYG